MIYLAGPYSDPSAGVREFRARKLTQLAATLTNEGHMVYSPITMFHEMAKVHQLRTDFEFYQKMNHHILDMCDEIIVYQLPGWDKSRGVQDEIEYGARSFIKTTYIPF